MGAPKPWVTRWPEPSQIPLDDDHNEPPMDDPDYEIDDDPSEDPFQLPEEQLMPYAVTWGVTHPCNLKCDHCYDVVTHRRKDLTTTQALTVIDRLAEAGITYIVFSGGEPMLRKDLFELMAHCGEYGIQIGMRTNGTLITPENAAALADLRLQVAGISLDGASPTIHNAVRGQGTFERTYAGIQSLLVHNIRVNVEVVLSKRNAHQHLDFVRLAEKWGVDELNFSAIAPQGRATLLADERLDHQQWQSLTRDLYFESQRASVVVSPSCALTGACWACVEPNVTCDGWVTPCYLSKRKLFNMLEIEGKEFRGLLRQHRQSTIDICGRRAWIQPELRSHYSPSAKI